MTARTETPNTSPRHNIAYLSQINPRPLPDNVKRYQTGVYEQPVKMFNSKRDFSTATVTQLQNHHSQFYSPYLLPHYFDIINDRLETWYQKIHDLEGHLRDTQLHSAAQWNSIQARLFELEKHHHGQGATEHKDVLNHVAQAYNPLFSGNPVQMRHADSFPQEEATLEAPPGITIISSSSENEQKYVEIGEAKMGGKHADVLQGLLNRCREAHVVLLQSQNSIH